MNWEAAASGLAGALQLTAMHELIRQRTNVAPRMDILGERAIARSFKAFGKKPPKHDDLHSYALAGDLVSNSMYYSLVGLGRPERVMLRGALLGLAAGIGAVVLPGPMGLGSAPSNRTRATQAMTIGYYLLGGLTAAATYRLLTSKPKLAVRRSTRSAPDWQSAPDQAASRPHPDVVKQSSTAAE